MARQGSKTPNSGRTAPMRSAGSANAPVATVTATEPKVKRPPFNPAKFFAEVRLEARRITWTSWRETWITSVMVFIMVAITGIFFLAVDQALGNGMQFLFKLAAS
jgi:preprotein translocase subunit SecE